jgi:hypothetical protein
VVRIEYDWIALLGLARSHDQSSHALLRVGFGLKLVQNCILESHLFVSGILNDESGRNWALVLQGQLEVLDGVDFGQTQVDNWLYQIQDRTAECGLARKADGRTVFNLYVEVGQTQTDFRAFNRKLNVY